MVRNTTQCSILFRLIYLGCLWNSPILSVMLKCPSRFISFIFMLAEIPCIAHVSMYHIKVTLCSNVTNLAHVTNRITICSNCCKNYNVLLVLLLVWWETFGIVPNMLDCNIIVNINSSHAITFTFCLIPLGKVWTPYPFQLWIK